ncbi:hypothetical protein [Nocardiopsis sp. FR6]|uniref:hypothetical protein n=1 Tax=Nocardiopsis sp. FR6 TaxID=2605986 RepID=UPI00135959A6|nr:hypothetical protein [Nocardiopsis sp. FR6]
MRQPRAVVFGSGHSGMTLATGLLADGWRVDVFTRHSTPELLGGPAGLTQITLPSVRAAERSLGLDLWATTAPETRSLRMAMVPDQQEPWSFTATLDAAATAVDHRLKTAYWLQRFESLGGGVHVKTCTVADVASFASSGMYDLVVVAPGVDSDLGRLFAPDERRIGGATDRVAVQAHLDGFARAPEDPDIRVITSPHGEVLIYPVLAHDVLTPAQVRELSGKDDAQIDVAPYWATCVQVLARPGSTLDPDPAVNATSGPTTKAGLPSRHGHHAQAAWNHVLSHLTVLAPDLAEQCAKANVIPHSELVRQIRPQVRHPVTVLGGVPVLGIGDATVTVEHASGQGAGASTLVATTVRDQIRQQRHVNGPLDRAFLTGAWEAYWARHGQYTSGFGEFVTGYWNGALPQTLLKAFAEAVATPVGANAWAAGLDDPARMAHFLAH